MTTGKLEDRRQLSSEDGSTSEKDKKNREERLKLMKERQELEHEKRLAELKAAYEKEQKIRQLKDAERLRRIQEIKMRESLRRQAVEERRRRLESEDKEKREQILAKYKEYEHRLNSQRDQKKPIYAFGSSTPRTLAYLEHLENSMRVYNARLASGGTGNEVEDKGGASSAEKRATSACSLTRKPLTASSSPNLSPQHQQQHRTRVTSSGVHHSHQSASRPPSTKTKLSPSGRWGGSMVASMYGGSASAATSHRDPLANVHSMTTSFAVGDTSAPSHVKNVRAKGPISATSARSQSTPRLARTTTTTPRKGRQDVSETSRTTGTVSKQRNGSDGHGDGAPLVAGHNQKAKGVSSARTPSAPPPAIRRPVNEGAPKPVAAPATSKTPATPKEKPKTSSSQKATPQKQNQGDHEVPIKIIRKPKPTSENSTPERATAASPIVVVSAHHEGEAAAKSPATSTPERETRESITPPSLHEEINVSIGSMHLEEDNLNEHGEILGSVSPKPSPVDAGHDIGGQQQHHYHDESVSEDSSPNGEVAPAVSAFKPVDVMNASTTEVVTNVPKPTGQGGKVLSQEEATAALAERRRLAREQMEREKELERQREEQRLREEEEARRREEEEFRRQEEEELRMLEEARRLEEERMQKMIEEEAKRREEEMKRKEEEERKKADAEARAREEAEKAEKERKEAEEKFKKDELERSERKKRLEAIMQRTRQSGGGAAATSTPISKPGGQNYTNGSGEHINDNVFSTPEAGLHTPANSGQSSPPHHSASASVLQKLANVRPEVGRSLENILNRVKSTPNVSDADHPTTNEGTLNPSIMTTSFSADKVSQGAANGDARLTQSYYVTPGGDYSNSSFNYSASESTEYDVDGTATKSQSHYARILFNQEAPGEETNLSATAALASIPGVLDSNANTNRSNTVSLLDSDFFDHNDNVNGGASATSNGHGHGSERASASDSDASSAVTVIHQKVLSPHEISFEDPFALPKRGSNALDDLINDNLSSSLSTSDGQSPKSVSVQSSTASHQERPLMDF